MTEPPPTATGASASEALDSYLRSLEAGGSPDRAALLARHPDLAAALESLDFVHRAAFDLGADTGDGPAGQALGDYRLLREVGRGGMAVVYEAEQVSLGRRVALKVLPFAAVVDPKQLQRFKNEALAAANLRHPHIVPVYAVGCERGIHYYAMQFVEGQSLALAIRDMKEGGVGEGPRTPISSHGSNREPAYIRMAVSLGVQAAEALDHAHQVGIVHRDVKPGNLLVDATGTLWVTDFGLALSAANPGLTITGEILGTVRYMSPEQALAKRVPIDHRTDVYSLGATLYELFTLRPAFPGDDPHLVIQDIAFRDPVAPRKLNPALPADLETILLKAMTKDPGGRYATALEMADDLRRYLEDKPVLARRPSLATRSARWARRHRGLVAGASALLLLGILALVADHIRVTREQRKTGHALRDAQDNLRLAREAVDSFLIEAGIASFEDQPLPSPARRRLLEKALAFYSDPESSDRRAGILHALHRYEEALKTLQRAKDGRPETRYNVGVTLRRMGDTDSAIREFREAIRLKPDFAEAYSNLGHALLHAGDPDGAIQAYAKLNAIRPSAEACYMIGKACGRNGDRDGEIRAYREAIRVRPDFAEAYSSLGRALNEGGAPEEAMAACREAIRLKPDYAEAHVNLGVAFAGVGKPDEAIREFYEAIRLRPDHAVARYNLGCTLFGQRDPEGAIREYREAIRLQPDFADAYCNIGEALRAQGRFEEALPWYRKGHELGSSRAGWPYPSKEWVEATERQAETEGRLNRVLSGKAQPRDGPERVEFAEILGAKSRHADAVRMWAEAFAEAPALAEDLDRGCRYDAACMAALAAARGWSGAEGMRALALDWLRADLAAREKAGVAATLGHWKRDPDLASVRDRIDGLPEPERAAWRNLWTAVDAALTAAPSPTK